MTGAHLNNLDYSTLEVGSWSCSVDIKIVAADQLKHKNDGTLMNWEVNFI